MDTPSELKTELREFQNWFDQRLDRLADDIVAAVVVEIESQDDIAFIQLLNRSP